MNFFKQMKLAQKIAVLSVSFLIFLVIIGVASIKQLSKVNSNLKELNDSRLTPIVYLENIKAGVEYIRTQANGILDARDDDAAKKSIEQDIEKRVTEVNQELSVYKDKSEYEGLLKNYEAFIAAKDAFIKQNGAGSVQQMGPQSGGAPDDIAKFDSTKRL